MLALLAANYPFLNVRRADSAQGGTVLEIILSFAGYNRTITLKADSNLADVIGTLQIELKAEYSPLAPPVGPAGYIQRSLQAWMRKTPGALEWLSA